MKLYYYPPSTYSQKAIIALHEKGAPFESELVMLFDQAERERYQAIYPLGKIPLLIRDDGSLLPESSAIVEWVDRTYTDGPKLIPAEPEAAATVRLLDRMADLYLNETVAALLFQSWRPEADRDQELIDKSRRRAGACFAHFEQTLAGRDYLAGDFSLADCATAPSLYYAEQVMPFGEYERVSSYWQRLQARDSIARVIADAQPYLAKIAAAREAAE